MRITNNMMFAASVRNLNQNLQRLNAKQVEMSTQSKIQVPSDDPVVATRAIKYRDYCADVEQYQKNTSDATSWMEVTESALQDVTDTLVRVKELTVKGASDTLADTDRQAIADEVAQLKAGLVQTLNTSYAGRYVFAGYATDEAPYEIVAAQTAGGTAVGDKVLFKGQYLDPGSPVAGSLGQSTAESFCAAPDPAAAAYAAGETQAISYHIGTGSEMKVNVEGQDVIGSGEDNLFNTLDKLLLGLQGESSYYSVDASGTATSHALALGELLGEFETALDRVTKAQADLGARMNYVELSDSRLDKEQITYTKLQSDNEDVDVAQASMEVSSAQAVYEAALSVTSKVTTKTLVDYLR